MIKIKVKLSLDNNYIYLIYVINKFNQYSYLKI